MNLIHFETRLDFFQETKLSTPAQSVFKALTGQKYIASERRPREPGVRIRRENENLMVLWNVDSCLIIYEDMPSEHCIQETIKLSDTISKVAPIGKLSSRMVRLFWILPVARYDFKTLELKYRENFIKQSTMFENCTDSSVILDMRCDNCVLHHQSGAMDISQLQSQYRTFKMKEEKPGLFIFLETNVSNREVVEYSSKEMSQFLSWSFAKCESHATGFQKVMEVIL
jgi:hypothetical protein